MHSLYAQAIDSNGNEAFLSVLKAHDATIDNIHLRYDRHGEKVKARPVRLNASGSQRVLPPIRLKYYYNMEYILRGQDVTQVRAVDQVKTETAEGYPQTIPYHKWSNKGGLCQDLADDGYSTRSKILETQHNSAWSSVMLEQLLQVEFALGYGFGKRLVRIDTLTATPTGWTLTGPFKIWGNDTGTCTLDLDKDYVVRKAVIDTVSVSNTLWKFEITTADSVRTDRFTFAKTGHFKQSFQGTRKGDQVIGTPSIREEFNVTFVDATFDLADETYEKLTDFRPQPNSMLIDKDTGEQFVIDEMGKKRLVGNYDQPAPPVQRSSVVITVIVVHTIVFIVAAAIYCYFKRKRAV